MKAPASLNWRPFNASLLTLQLLQRCFSRIPGMEREELPASHAKGVETSSPATVPDVINGKLILENLSPPNGARQPSRGSRCLKLTLTRNWPGFSYCGNGSGELGSNLGHVNSPAERGRWLARYHPLGLPHYLPWWIPIVFLKTVFSSYFTFSSYP